MVESIGLLCLVYKCTIFHNSPYVCTMKIMLFFLSKNLDSLKCKRGGSLSYGGRYFSWGFVQMTLILWSKNDPQIRRIMTTGHYSTGNIICRCTDPGNSGRKWEFQFGNIRKVPTIGNSNVIFTRTADRIAMTFCNEIECLSLKDNHSVYQVQWHIWIMYSFY